MSFTRLSIIILATGLVACGKSTGEVKNQRPAEPLASPTSPTPGATPATPAIPATPESPTPAPPSPPDPPSPPEKSQVALQPLGKFPAGDLALVGSALEQVYGWEVLILEPVEHPAEAWYPKRKRWRAEKLLDWLRPRLPDGATRIMALTRDDISTTKGDVYDWGICGLADLEGAASVVSTFRIKRNLGKLKGSALEKKYRQRLRDLVAHEFGHTLSLPHCPNKGCIMEDAKGSVLTFDHSTGKLCDDCLRKLAEAGYPMP